MNRTTLSIMLAENFTGLSLIFLAICLLPVVGIVAGRTFIKRRGVFLTFGIIGIIIGTLLLLLLSVDDGGAFSTGIGLWIACSFPLLTGIVCLFCWVFRK